MAEYQLVTFVCFLWDAFTETMAGAVLWEGQFRDYLLSQNGRQLIAGQPPDKSVGFVPVVFLACDLAEFCPRLFQYLMLEPIQTLARCHDILTEVGRQIFSETMASVDQLVRHG